MPARQSATWPRCSAGPYNPHASAAQRAKIIQSIRETFAQAGARHNKSVVLLEYADADHVFEGRDKDDLQLRMLQFFDHFLMGAEAPPWWSQGISYMGQ